MPTLEELYARLQMEENFQVGERKHDPEEALVMRIRNVVRRRFSQPPHSFANYHQMQGQGNFSANRPQGSGSQDFVYHRCHKPGHAAHNCMALAPLHQLPVNYRQGNSFGRGSIPTFGGIPTSASQGAHNMNHYGANILDGNSGEFNSTEIPSEELLEVAFDVLNLQTNEDWIMDSRASAHFSGDRSSFSTLDPSYQNSVTSTSGQSYYIEGQGIAEIALSTSEIKSIHDVHYVPGLYCNILSVGKIADLGHLIIFDKSSCLVISKGKPLE